MSKIVISKKLAFINSASAFFIRVLSISVLVWLQRFLLSTIDVDEYSLLPVLTSLIVFLPLFSGTLTNGLSRFVIEAYATGDNQRVTQITSSMSLLIFPFGLVILVAGGIFAWNVGNILTVSEHLIPDARLMMFLMVISFVLNTVMTPFLTGFHVKQKFVALNLIKLGQELLRFALLFLLLFGIGPKVLWLVVASFIADITSLCVKVTYSYRLVPSIRFRFSQRNWSVAKEVSSFGGWSILGQLANLIRLSANPIILNKLSTELEVACFHLGSMPTTQISQFLTVIQQPLNPQLTALYAMKRMDDLRKAYVRVNRYALLVVLLVAVPLMVFADELVILWVGSNYSDAALVAILGLAVFPTLYANMLMGNIVIATGKIRQFAIFSLLIQIGNLLLTLYLVGEQHLGAVGAAFSNFVTMSFVFPVVMIPITLRLIDLKLSRFLRDTVIPGWLPGIAAVFVALSLKYFLQPDTILWLILSGVIITSVYVLTALRFSLTEEDHKMINTFLTETRAKIPFL